MTGQRGLDCGFRRSDETTERAGCRRTPPPYGPPAVQGDVDSRWRAALYRGWLGIGAEWRRLRETTDQAKLPVLATPEAALLGHKHSKEQHK